MSHADHKATVEARNEWLKKPHDPTWVSAQKGAFARWINVVLVKAHSYRHVTAPTLLQDLSDGVVLLQVLQTLYPSVHLPRWWDPPTVVVQKLDNCTTLLRAVEMVGIKMTFCTPKNIVEADEAPVMGLVWLLIKEFEVKEALVKAQVLETLVSQDIKAHPDHHPEPLIPLAPADVTTIQSSTATSQPGEVASATTTTTPAPVATTPAPAAAPTPTPTPAPVASADTNTIVVSGDAPPSTPVANPFASAASSSSSSASASSSSSTPATASSSASAHAPGSTQLQGSTIGWKAALLAWIRKRCEPLGVAVHSLRLSGRQLWCVVHSLEPEAVAHLNKATCSLKDVMHAAQQHMRVPMLWEPTSDDERGDSDSDSDSDSSSSSDDESHNNNNAAAAPKPSKKHRLRASEWTWALYLSQFLTYVPRRFNYLRAAFDRALGLLERLDAAHQEVLSRLDDKKLVFEDSVSLLAQRAKGAAKKAYADRRTQLQGYFSSFTGM